MSAFVVSNFRRQWFPCALACFLCLISGSFGYAAEAAGELVIAATVNGEPIYESEVQRELRTAFGTREIAESAVPYFQAKTLAQLIDRRLIVQWLGASGRGASETEVALEISRLEKRLQSREITLTEHLASIKITEPEMRRLIEWQIAWRKFLARYLTDENLEAYFNDHRREFDGTRMRVAHILLKVESDDDTSIERAIQRANEIRNSIISRSTSFEDAAHSNSSAPTAANGGDIGFIQRDKPMHETFARAAFALDKGQISMPVTTPFGVHLIRCLEIEPGKRTWQDARDELTSAVTRYLFDWAAKKERAAADIQFTNVLPHFVPGSEEIAR